MSDSITLSDPSIESTITDFVGLSNKTFIGFRRNLRTGHLNVEIINDGVTPVSLPQEGITNPDDYVNWFWTKDTIGFKWWEKGHLLIEIK